MDEKEAKIEELCRRAALAGLEGVEFLQGFDYAVLAREYNGIGPEWAGAGVRAWVTRHAALFEPAALIHDMRNYESDGLRRAFNYANAEFLVNCLRLADGKYPWYSWRRYRARLAAHVFFDFVDGPGGWKAWRECYERARAEAPEVPEAPENWNSERKTRMKKPMMLMLAACAAVAMTTAAGCRAVTVRNYGEEVVCDADGKPVTLADGKIQTVKKGWKVHHNQHWMATDVDTMEARIRPEDISFQMGKASSRPSEELTKLVDVSLKGAAELAAKVGAAIATSGGSVAGDAAAAAITQSVKNYISKGGSVENATVTCEGGSCTISDGTITETCEDCIAK